MSVATPSDLVSGSVGVLLVGIYTFALQYSISSNLSEPMLVEAVESVLCLARQHCKVSLVGPVTDPAATSRRALADTKTTAFRLEDAVSDGDQLKLSLSEEEVAIAAGVEESTLTLVTPPLLESLIVIVSLFGAGGSSSQVQQVLTETLDLPPNSITVAVQIFAPPSLPPASPDDQPPPPPPSPSLPPLLPPPSPPLPTLPLSLPPLPAESILTPISAKGTNPTLLPLLVLLVLLAPLIFCLQACVRFPGRVGLYLRWYFSHSRAEFVWLYKPMEFREELWAELMSRKRRKVGNGKKEKEASAQSAPSPSEEYIVSHKRMGRARRSTLITKAREFNTVSGKRMERARKILMGYAREIAIARALEPMGKTSCPQLGNEPGSAAQRSAAMEGRTDSGRECMPDMLASARSSPAAEVASSGLAKDNRDSGLPRDDMTGSSTGPEKEKETRKDKVSTGSAAPEGAPSKYKSKEHRHYWI